MGGGADIMAMKTFDNLSRERREQILDRCYAEFAEKGYEGASIAAIISDLGLARGSFYRYFEDKIHLYKYLYTSAIEASLREYSHKPGEPERDFLETWKALFMKAVEKTGGYPAYLHFLSRASQERRPEIYLDPEIRGFDKRMRMVEGVLSDGQKKGKVRADVDPRLMSLVFLQSRYALGQYMILRTENGKIKPRSKKFMEILEAAIDGYLAILRRGFRGGKT